ncbi:hypothetical protein BDW67DRAFT_172599 [Aspergillus spinulosporus]
MATTLQFDGLPGELDPGFQSVVNFEPESSDGSDYVPPDYTDNQKRNAPYVSFGNGTMTATSSAFGSILRVSQYLDRPDLASKMLALDYADVPPPFFIVTRANHLINQAQSHRNGLGLRISQVGGDDGTEGPTAPALTFLGDRWPRIRYSVGYELDVTVDLVCRDHMVLQRMCITNKSEFKETLNLEFDPRFRLRDLDYTTSKDDPQPGMMERLPSNRRGKQLSVVVGLWEDGVSQKLNDDSILPIKRDMNYRASKEYVAAFTIQNNDEASEWEDFVITGTEVSRCLQELPVESVSWEWPHAERAHTRWSLRRNLEHILGVCSISALTMNPGHGSGPAEVHAPPSIVVDEALSQVSVSGENSDAPQIILETSEGDSYFIQGPNPSRFELQRINDLRKANEQQSTPSSRMTEALRPGVGSFSTAVSLTCSDFGDHRVCISGSYFAFMFMLKIERIRAEESIRRIHETCKSHLLWISILSHRDSLSTNLWVNGTSIPGNSDTSLPPDSPPNMPYHIIKEWVDHLPLHDDQELIQKVQEEKKKIQMETGSSQAVRMTLGANQASSTRALDDFLREVEPLFARDMRKQSLRRFTLENDVLKKRMLGVTRSTRETRFLFHSRDPVLYYGKTWRFLKKDQMDLFEQLVKAQIHHDEEGVDETRWDNSQRYALALLMAQSRHQLDRDIEPDEMSRHNEALNNPDSTDSAVKGPARQESAITQKMKIAEIPTTVLEKAAISSEGSESGAHSERLAVFVQKSLKRQNPYGRLVDTSNIVEVPEEWLYKYPDFLDYEPPNISDVESIIIDGRILLGDEQNTPSGIVRQMANDEHNPSRYSFIEDVRKSRKQHKRGTTPKSVRHECRSFLALWEYLKQPRYALWAKKRFIYLKLIDPVQAMICCVAPPESERLHLAQFFNHYRNSKPCLRDDTTVARNLWVTEVYFQFFHKLKHGQKPSGQVSSMFKPVKPSGRPFCLDTAFTGFRIRRVLELILLSRMLKKVCTSSEETLDEVDIEPGENQHSFYQGQILLLLKKNMTSLREIIDRWDMRESSQGRERPRWTRRDEQKYRRSIKKERALLEGHMRDVRTKEIRIEFLLGRVISAQEAVPSKKSLREAENITLFTYVTVFFLPTGLAASIFSMGDIPSRKVVGWMVVTAVVALVITISILYGVLYHFHLLSRFWESDKPAAGRTKAMRTVTDADGVPGRPLVEDSFPTKWSPKGWLLSLRRLDTRSLNDDPASKHV